MSSSIKEANRLFREGAYREALSAYGRISAEKPGWSRFLQANISLCRNRLNLKTNLSIVVPVFNSGKYLEQCLLSILHQNEVSIEIIVINDGSTDNSLEIIQRMMQKDNRIILINNKSGSGNPGTPRNQGIAIARGKYLCFVDSDDWIEPDYYEQLLAVIDREDLDMVFAGGYTNQVNGSAKVVSYNSNHFCGPDTDLHGYHESFMIWDKVYKTHLIKSHSIKLGETKAAVDVPFIFKAYYFLKKVGFAETNGYNYRRESESSVTVNFRKSSNCSFEIQAYKNVEDWCSNVSVKSQYVNLVKFRKVSSYIYTLSVISLDYFHDFFAKVTPELRAIDSDLIARLSNQLNRPIVFDKFKAITRGDANAYLKKHRNDYPKIDSAGSVGDAAKKVGVNLTSTHVVPTFNIEGDQRGVLFFPDWSHTNPYQKLFYGSLAQNYGIRVKGYKPERFVKEILNENRDRFGFVHLHWLHALMDLSREDGADDLLGKLIHAKKLGYKIIYTAHNILSHDTEFPERELRFRKTIAKYYDYILVHGELAKQRVINEIGVAASKIHVMPHGTYRGYYQNHVTRLTARRKLRIDQKKFIFLFFGNIKGYKGLDSLLDCYKKIKRETSDVGLIIAGRILDKECESLIRAHVSADPSILLNISFVENNDVQYYYNAADMVILPYRRILSSGAALLSISFNKPIIAPRSGLMPEIIDEGKQGYLFDSYAEMMVLMKRAVVQGKNSSPWISGFDFSKPNAELRWPLLTAHPVFRDIFAVTPKTDQYTVKRSRYCYALIRILGNDLPERHSNDQTYNNLEFTLKHEMEFEDCLKIWVLNRILDKAKKVRLIDLLSKYGKRFIDIPFDYDSFCSIKYCFEDLPKDDFKLTREFHALNERDRNLVDYAIYRFKNNYLINNNGARNTALQEGMQHADWVLPWDGNCFVTTQAWGAITSMLKERCDLQYHLVPMDRVRDNSDILRHDYIPNPSEEPQVVFRKDAALRFNELMMYGIQPKVELLKRLGLPGKWDKSNRLYPWASVTNFEHGPHTHNFSWAGWVARLSSGNQSAEVDDLQRALTRERGVINFIKTQELSRHFKNFERGNLAFYDEILLEKMRSSGGAFEQGLYAKTMAHLKSSAINYLDSPLYSVIDKTTLPPSGDVRDYWHPAPYCWPNPASPDGLPYIYRDGERVTGTKLYEAESNKYDRTGIQKVFDETTALALAGYIFSCPAYTEKASKLIRRWFIDEKTAMKPHLKYSQVVMGKNGNCGTASGLIETKDMYFFLDAVRLVRKSRFWSKVDEQKMLAWCNNFLSWLNTSDQGCQEVATSNNHGVAFDLQTYALAAFIGDIEQMHAVLLRALSRMKGHFDKNGMQPHEMKRTTTAHYTAFNLHIWFNLSVIIRNSAEYNLFNEERAYGVTKINPLKKATIWVLDRANGNWPFKQIDEFDKERYQHLYHTASRHSTSIRNNYKNQIKKISESNIIFFPHDGIAPFWTLQR
jgi:glycosyltransferase involved in cell wall biosynthesis